MMGCTVICWVVARGDDSGGSTSFTVAFSVLVVKLPTPDANEKTLISFFSLSFSNPLSPVIAAQSCLVKNVKKDERAEKSRQPGVSNHC